MRALVIGAGPSIKKYNQYDEIRIFEGIKICADGALKQMLENNIIPSYVVSNEENSGIMDFYKSDLVHKYKSMFKIFLVTVDAELIEYLDENDFHFEILQEDKNMQLLQSSGGVAWYIAGTRLNCDTVCLIGMNQSRPLKYLEHFSEDVIKDFFIVQDNYCMDPPFEYFSKTLIEFIKLFKDKFKTVNLTPEGPLCQI